MLSGLSYWSMRSVSAKVNVGDRISRRLTLNPLTMQHKSIQVTGLALTAIYAAFIIWVYATEPRTFREVANSASVAAGSYQVDQEKFNAALALFRREQFRAAREQWQQADPAQSDARTQFYLAYAFYREGWGRVYYDQDLFKQGLEKVNRAIELAPQGPLTVDDPNLQMHSAAELKAELEQGTERGWSDLNPLKVLRTRK
jgi:tetratricopeptide (TPR) repeat protein